MASRYRQVEKRQLRREAGPHLGEAEEEAEQRGLQGGVQEDACNRWGVGGEAGTRA